MRKLSLVVVAAAAAALVLAFGQMRRSADNHARHIRSATEADDLRRELAETKAALAMLQSKLSRLSVTNGEIDKV